MLSWGPRQRIAGGVLTRLDRWSRYKASPRHWLGLVDEVQQRTAGPVPTGLGLVQTYARSFLARGGGAVMGRLVEVADTKLYVQERGEPSAFPLLVFHGGPGLDHTEFGDYLDPLTEGGGYRLVLADERACGRSDRTAPRETWTLERMAEDVSDLAASVGVSNGYATLGHSYGAFIVLQHAVAHPGEPRGTIVSAGIPAARWLEGVDQQLASFEPADLREQVTLSWARETEVETEGEVAALLDDQMPFHFQEPRGAALREYLRRTAGLARYAPDVIRHFAAQDYGGIDVEDQLGGVRHPVLVLAGRHDRTCPAAAAEDMARRLPDAELVVFENSAHMMFAEEQDRYLATVRRFLDRITN
jgi:proline iminopeptidase